MTVAPSARPQARGWFARAWRFIGGGVVWLSVSRKGVFVSWKVLLLAACAAALVVLNGCGRGFGTLLGSLGAGTGEPPAPDYGNLGWWATCLIGAGAVTLALSFAFPLIPRAASLGAIATGVGLLVLKATLAKFMVYLPWAVLAVGLWFAWSQGKRLWLDRKGKHLARNGNRDAGGALMALARGWTAMKDTPILGRRHHEKRKALLARVAGPPVTGASA